MSKIKLEISKVKMNINRWFKEDKGGFGAFLILVIMGLAFYAFQRKEPVADYDLPASETQAITTTRQVNARKPFTETSFSDTMAGASDSVTTDSSALAREKEIEQAKVKASTASAKLKSKAWAKPVRKRLSNEDLVRSKLRAGMSVRQIAKATGLEKKYIRGVKKKKECNCPG